LSSAWHLLSPPNGFCDLDQSLPLSKGCQSSMQCKHLTRAIPLCRCSISRCCSFSYTSHDVTHKGGWHMSGYAFDERDRLSCPTRYVSHYLLFCAFDAPLQVQLQFPDLEIIRRSRRNPFNGKILSRSAALEGPMMTSTPRTSRVGDYVTPRSSPTAAEPRFMVLLLCHQPQRSLTICPLSVIMTG
jgi:hypothetical protein